MISSSLTDRESANPNLADAAIPAPAPVPVPVSIPAPAKMPDPTLAKADAISLKLGAEEAPTAFTVFEKKHPLNVNTDSRSPSRGDSEQVEDLKDSSTMASPATTSKTEKANRSRRPSSASPGPVSPGSLSLTPTPRSRKTPIKLNAQGMAYFHAANSTAWARKGFEEQGVAPDKMSIKVVAEKTWLGADTTFRKIEADVTDFSTRVSTSEASPIELKGAESKEHEINLNGEYNLYASGQNISTFICTGLQMRTKFPLSTIRYSGAIGWGSQSEHYYLLSPKDEMKGIVSLSKTQSDKIMKIKPTLEEASILVMAYGDLLKARNGVFNSKNYTQILLPVVMNPETVTLLLKGMEFLTKLRNLLLTIEGVLEMKDREPVLALGEEMVKHFTGDLRTPKSSPSPFPFSESELTGSTASSPSASGLPFMMPPSPSAFPHTTSTGGRSFGSTGLPSPTFSPTSFITGGASPAPSPKSEGNTSTETAPPALVGIGSIISGSVRPTPIKINLMEVGTRASFTLQPLETLTSTDPAKLPETLMVSTMIGFPTSPAGAAPSTTPLMMSSSSTAVSPALSPSMQSPLPVVAGTGTLRFFSPALPSPLGSITTLATIDESSPTTPTLIHSNNGEID